MKRKQRLQEISGLRQKLDNDYQLLSQLNYSLQQYESAMDQTDDDPHQPISMLASMKDATYHKKKTFQFDQYFDPQNIIHPKKQVKQPSNTPLPKIIDSLIQPQPSKQLQDKSKDKKQPIKGINNAPTFIIPKNIRNNPFANKQIVHQDQLSQGLFQLINQGVISKDVDVSPVFQKDNPPLKTKGQIKHPFYEKQQRNLFSKKFLKNTRQSSRNTQTRQKRTRSEHGVQVQTSSQQNVVSNMESQLEFLELFQIHHIKIIQFKIDPQSIYIYKITYLQHYGLIEHLLQKIGKIIKMYNLQNVTIDGRKLAILALDSRFNKVKNRELANCVIEKALRCKLSKKNDIIIIQSLIRRFLCRKHYMHLQLLHHMAAIIQRMYRKWKIQKKLKTNIRKNQEQRYQNWIKEMDNFRNEWSTIKFNQRIEIHLCNDKPKDFKGQSNVQITRIFRVHDPLVHVIYISYCAIQEEVKNYYYKILELGQVQQTKSRLYFFNSKTEFQYSSQIKQLKKLIHSKSAYLIGGKDYQKAKNLGIWLGVPVMGGELVDYKPLLMEQDIPFPPSSAPLKNYKELLQSLTLLIINNQEIKIWLFKLKSRKIIGKLNIKDLQRIDATSQLEIDDTYYNLIYSNLENELIQKLQVKINVYQFLTIFLKEGGYIEAHPPSQQLGQISVIFNLDPEGNVEVLGSYERLQIGEFQNYAIIYPKEQLKELDLKKFSQSVGDGLMKQGLFGYVCVDLVQFNLDDQQFWIIDMDLYLKEEISIYFYFNFLMEGQVNQTNGEYNCKIYLENQTQRVNKQFLYIPYFFNQNLLNKNINTFFKSCRKQGISFDLEQKEGITYILIDNIEDGILGLMTIHDTSQQCKTLANTALNFIIKQPPSNMEMQLNPKLLSMQNQIQSFITYL